MDVSLCLLFQAAGKEERLRKELLLQPAMKCLILFALYTCAARCFIHYLHLFPKETLEKQKQKNHAIFGFLFEISK